MWIKVWLRFAYFPDQSKRDILCFCFTGCWWALAMLHEFIMAKVSWSYQLHSWQVSFHCRKSGADECTLESMATVVATQLYLFPIWSFYHSTTHLPPHITTPYLPVFSFIVSLILDLLKFLVKVCQEDINKIKTI